MIELEFKALMYLGKYVDANLIEKGIYTCSKPFIYSKETTIESMKEAASIMRDMAGIKFISGRYFENIDKCELVPIKIEISNKAQ